MMTRQKAERILGVTYNDELYVIESAYNKLVQDLYAKDFADQDRNAAFQTLTTAYNYLCRLKELGVEASNDLSFTKHSHADDALPSEVERNIDLLDYAMKEGHIVISFLIVLAALLNVLWPHYSAFGSFGAGFLFVVIVLFFGVPALLRWRNTDRTQLKKNFILAVKHSALFHLSLALFGALGLFFVLLDQLLDTVIFAFLAMCIYLFWHFKLKRFLLGTIGKPLALKLGLTFWTLLFICQINKLGRFETRQEVYRIVLSNEGSSNQASYLEQCHYNNAHLF
jgi:hypothetical protein